MAYELFDHGQKKIYLINMLEEKNKVFSELVLWWIKKYINQWKKIAIIVNKKWYSSGVLCQDCGYIPKCDNCDVSVSYHMDKWWNFFGICHICKKAYNTLEKCPNCGWYNIKPYGVWTQKISELLLEQFGKKSVIIESETANSTAKIERIYQELKKNNIIIGTSLLTTPIKDITFDLIIFLNADLWLNIPDFNSNLGNFLFLYETFQKHKTKTFLVQSFNIENYTIKNACKLDFEGFRKEELKFREDFEYPPYVEMAVILYKNEIEENLFGQTNKLYQELLFLKENMWLKDLEIFSTPPLIYKIFGKYRYNIILKSKDLRPFLDAAFEKLKIYERGFKLDREPGNII